MRTGPRCTADEHERSDEGDHHGRHLLRNLWCFRRSVAYTAARVVTRVGDPGSPGSDSHVSVAQRHLDGSRWL